MCALSHSGWKTANAATVGLKRAKGSKVLCIHRAINFAINHLLHALNGVLRTLLLCTLGSHAVNAISH